MARLKSTAVWYDLPGVEAAYMPIGAPDPVSARMNVGHTDALGNHRMAGRYTATPGTAPTWNSASGWTFVRASGHYLSTGVVQTSISWSALMRYTSWTVVSPASYLFGASSGSSYSLGIDAEPTGYFLNGGYVASSAVLSDGVAGISGLKGYKNGVNVATLSSGSVANVPIYIGATNSTGSPFYFSNVNALVFALASRILTPAEMWLASRQMAYCEQNPDWNAWGRRRQYYYAPSAAAGRVGIYGARGAVALPGGVSIRGGNHG